VFWIAAELLLCSYKVEHSDAVFDRVCFHTAFSKHILGENILCYMLVRVGKLHTTGNVKTYAVTEVKVHMIVALKYSLSKHMLSVCLVVHCNISGSSILCCNKTTEFMTHLKLHLMLILFLDIGTVWKWVILL